MNIYVTPEDLYLITFKGMVLVLEGINKPRLFDVQHTTSFDKEQ